MKRYKLKKDLPTIKAGAIFEEVTDDFSYLKSIARVTPVGTEIPPKFTVKDIDNFDDWFEEIPEPKRWRAEYGGEYAYIADDGLVSFDNDRREDTDNYRYRTGNYARVGDPRSLVEYKEYNIARQVLLDDAKGGKWKKRVVNFYVYYDYDMKKWIVGYDIEGMQTIGAIYFQDEEDAEESLKEHKEQWDIVRKYETKE
jgi:hypothetical protein